MKGRLLAFEEGRSRYAKRVYGEMDAHFLV